MTTRITDEPEIGMETRLAVMSLVYAVCRMHPEARQSDDHCHVCVAVTRLLKVLDDNQRQYGPPLDMSDPSAAPYRTPDTEDAR